MSNRRQTQIDLNTIGVGRDGTTQRLDSRKRKAFDASFEDLVKDYSHGIAYTTRTERRPQLVRPSEFPINANGLVKSGEPWNDFEQSYCLRLGLDYRVIVAERKASPYSIVAIRAFAGAMKESQIRLLQGIQQENFARTLNVFRSADATYIVFEHAHVSLHEISRSRLSITKLQLAAILGQSINGLTYLGIQGLEHGSLSRTNMLVTMDGVIKIAAFEKCCKRTPDSSESSDLKALGRIAMELMQDGRTENADTVGVRDLGAWDADVASFLAETVSTTSPAELKKQPLLCMPWNPRHLRRQVAIAIMSVRIGFSMEDDLNTQSLE